MRHPRWIARSGTKGKYGYVAQFDCADLTGAQFDGAGLAGTVFGRANLDGVNFDRANVSRVDFSNARNLQNAYFGEACADAAPILIHLPAISANVRRRYRKRRRNAASRNQ